MAPRLKPIKDEKELAAVPLDEPVLVELEPPASGEEREPEPERKAAPQEPDKPESDAAKLERQLASATEAERRSRERAETAEREVREARQESERLRTTSADTQKDFLTSSLASAQAEEAAAQAELERAFESGDSKAMGMAQSKIGRAAAKIVNFEGAIAQFDLDAKAEKDAPKPAEPQLSIEEAIDRDPKLLSAERDWLKAHTEVLTDTARNTELSVGYARALKAGHKRGTPAYFQFLDQFLGYSEPEKPEPLDDPDNERAAIVSAPVTRETRTLSGRPATPTRITLSPEQREMARSMGLTDVQYARGKLQLDANKKADPERFAGR